MKKRYAASQIEAGDILYYAGESILIRDVSRDDPPFRDVLVQTYSKRIFRMDPTTMVVLEKGNK